MDATALFKTLNRHGVTLEAASDGRLTAHGDIDAIAKHREAIREHKAALLALLAESQKLEAMAASIAAEFGTTARHCLSILDDGDRRAIASGDTEMLEAWRCAMRLEFRPAPAPEPTGGGGDPLAALCHTPAGWPLTVQARDPGHAAWLRRVNPRPVPTAERDGRR